VGVTIQTGWTSPAKCSVTVTDGGGPVTVSFAVGQHFRSTQEVLDYLKAEIEAALASTWTFEIAASHCWISMSAYPFDWDWDTATDLRDYLGYAGNAVAQGAIWGSPSVIVGYVRFDIDAVKWLPEYSGASEHWTLQSIMADGKTEQASVGEGLHRKTNLVIDLDNTAGTFDEHLAWDAWLILVDDGRQFTVWPQNDDDSICFWGCIDPSQQSITIKMTYPRVITHWRTSVRMLIQGVAGE